jgi:hypothetical protein
VIVTDGGLTCWFDQREQHTVPVAEVVAIEAWPDGARNLYQANGDEFEFEPTLWEDGPELVTRLDQIWSADLRIPQPQRPVGDIPTPRAAPKPTAAGLATDSTAGAPSSKRKRLSTAELFGGILVLIAAAGIIALVIIFAPPRISVLIATVSIGAYLQNRVKKRKT